MEWTNGLWTFNGERKTRIGHPAPFPVELPLRCMKLFSFVGDTVLDPFMGSGIRLWRPPAATAPRSGSRSIRTTAGLHSAGSRRKGGRNKATDEVVPINARHHQWIFFE